MHVLVISHDVNTAIVIASIVESVKQCVTSWHPDWNVYPDAERGHVDLIIGCVASAEDVFAAEKFLTNEQSEINVKAVLLIAEQLNAADKIKFLRLGVSDVLEQPINLQHVRFLIDSFAVRFHIHPQATQHVSEPFAEPFAARQLLEEEILKLSKVDCNVLLTGETGVGKTHIAHQIHGFSGHGKLPFEAVNCAAIPDELIESELFGHKKGSFTGADANRVGIFEHAGEGTILLDEVDALPIGMQATLLHAIEDREFRRVGSNSVIPLRARIISASNQDLETLIAEKRFRADLFYRLNVYELKVPALRDRIEEIGFFADQFAQEFGERNDRTRSRFSEGVLQAFYIYDWPGNLRELRNTIEFASVNCEAEVIELEHLPSKLADCAGEAESGEQSQDGITIPFKTHGTMRIGTESEDWLRNKAEIAEIIRLLCKNNYNRTKTAEALGISRTALYNKLSKYKLA